MRGNRVTIREQTYSTAYDTQKQCFLGADIGGTNSNFGFFQLDNQKICLVLSAHIKSQEITHFEQAVQEVLEYVHKKYALTV